MSDEQTRQFVDQATQAIQRGQFNEALDLCDRALALDSGSADAMLLKAISLSNLRRSDEATDAFRSAVSLAPQSPKVFYNFAVHYYGIGQKERSLEMAREAVRLDPNHGQARDLSARIESETGAAPADLPQQPAAQPGEAQPFQQQPGGYEQTPGAYYRPGYYGEQYGKTHSIRFVEQMGKGWAAAGLVLAVVEGARFIFAMSYVIPAFQKFMAASAANKPMDPQEFARMINPYPIVGLIGYLTLALLMLWMILDISDRRGNWIWLVPLVLGCCCGVHWIVLLLYLAVGRK